MVRASRALSRDQGRVPAQKAGQPTWKPRRFGVLKGDRCGKEIIACSRGREGTLAAVLLLVQICLVGGGMATVAMRTMAAKLKQKIPVAVQRVFASSRAPATSSNPRAGVDNLRPELRWLLEDDNLDPLLRRIVVDFAKIQAKKRRAYYLGSSAGIGLGGLLLALGIYRINS